jgi:probable addiction module antidote protein
MKNKFQSWDEYMQEQLTANPEEIMTYLDVSLEEYENDGDIDALLIAIKRVAEVKGGITELAKKTNLSRQNLYKIFSHKVTPRFDNIVKILNALGYRFAIKKVANA